MINVDFFITDKGYLLGFEIYGHAEFKENGYDIVCAAVSSAAFLVANTVSEIIKVAVSVRAEDSGYMYLKINNNDVGLCKDILLGLKLHMLNLEEQYPKNITVNYVEV